MKKKKKKYLLGHWMEEIWGRSRKEAAGWGMVGPHKPALYPGHFFSNFAPMLAPPTDEHFMKQRVHPEG